MSSLSLTRTQAPRPRAHHPDPVLNTQLSRYVSPAVTLDHRHPALRSNRHLPRTAVRRGAAWPPAERPSSCLTVQPAVSRWQGPHGRAVMVAERRACRPRQHASPSQRCRGVRVSGWRPCLGRLARALRKRPRVRRPPVQCPTSGTCPASARPVSARPGVRASRCPVPCVRASVRHSVRLVSVSALSAPVSSWTHGCGGSHTSRDRPGWVGYSIRGRLSLG
jgi:hypothetical protein